LQSLLDGARPTLAGSDVQLVEPDSGSSGLQIFGQPKSEFGILSTIAEKSRWRVRWQGLCLRADRNGLYMLAGLAKTKTENASKCDGEENVARGYLHGG
jgi:hypothetical protein